MFNALGFAQVFQGPPYRPGSGFERARSQRAVSLLLHFFHRCSDLNSNHWPENKAVLHIEMFSEHLGAPRSLERKTQRINIRKKLIMVDSIDRSPLLAGKHSTPLLPNCYTTVFQCSSTRVLQNPSNPASLCSSTPVDHLRCVEFSSVACQSCLQIEQRHDSSRLLASPGQRVAK